MAPLTILNALTHSGMQRHGGNPSFSEGDAGTNADMEELPQPYVANNSVANPYIVRGNGGAGVDGFPEQDDQRVDSDNNIGNNCKVNPDFEESRLLPDGRRVEAIS